MVQLLGRVFNPTGLSAVTYRNQLGASSVLLPKSKRAKPYQAQHGHKYAQAKRCGASSGNGKSIKIPHHQAHSVTPCLHGMFQRCLACARLFPPLAQIVYARLLRLLYKLQLQIWRLVRKHDPQPYEHSVLGFLEPRLRMLSRVSAICLLRSCNAALRYINRFLGFVHSRLCPLSPRPCRGWKNTGASMRECLWFLNLLHMSFIVRPRCFGLFAFFSLYFNLKAARQRVQKRLDFHTVVHIPITCWPSFALFL